MGTVRGFPDFVVGFSTPWLLAAFRRERPGLYPVVLLLTHAGLRVGEAAGLEWSDVDLDPARRTLTVQRTFSTESDATSPPTLAALVALVEGRDPH